MRKYIGMGVALLAMAGLSAQAADYAWTGASDNNWGDASNWSPATGVPGGAIDNAIFDSGSTSNLMIGIGAGFWLPTITVGSPSADIVIESVNVNSGSVDMSAATKDLTILSPWPNSIRIQAGPGPYVLNVPFGRTLTFTNAQTMLSGKTLSTSGDGTVVMQLWLDLNRENKVDATTLNVPSGTLITKGLRLWHQQNTVNQTGGTVEMTGGGVLMALNSSSYDNTYNLAGGTLKTVGVGTAGSSGGTARFVFDGGTYLSTANGEFSADVELRIDAGGAIFDTMSSNETLSVRTEITGVGGLTKDGLGDLWLNTTNSYSGTTTVNAGRILANSGALGFGDVMVAGDATLVMNYADAADEQANLTVEANGVLQLNFIGTNTIGQLSLDGGNSTVVPGIYGAEQANIIGDGFVQVTSSTHLPAFIGFSGELGNLVKIVVYAPNAAHTDLLGKTDLVHDSSWNNVPHSDNGINPFVVTNLGYSTAEGTNVAIYVSATNAAFFRFGSVAP